MDFFGLQMLSRGLKANPVHNNHQKMQLYQHTNVSGTSGDDAFAELWFLDSLLGRNDHVPATYYLT